MATTTTNPVSEYLATTYRPDRDYVDGELQERNLGEYDHGSVQLFLGALLLSKSSEWHIRVITELRVQVSESRFRIPDICVLDARAPKEQIVHYPPLLCIEILSPDDTVYRMRDRIHDYLNMGVPQVWLLDPRTRTAIVCSGNTMVEHTAGDLTLPGSPIVVSIPQIFSVLDQA
jgi:Uma2 family endonuclease